MSGPTTIELRDSTAGRRSPITVSRIGSWDPWWGRQDLAVYLTTFPTLVVAVVALAPVWLVSTRTFGIVSGSALSMMFVFAVPMLVAVVTIRSGLQARNVPRALIHLMMRFGFQFESTPDVPTSRSERRMTVGMQDVYVVPQPSDLPPDLRNSGWRNQA